MSTAENDIKIRIAEALNDNDLKNAVSEPEQTETIRLVESYGQSVDADEDEWRPLTGDAKRDLAPMTQSRMQKLGVYLWESNLLANRLIELPVAYLLAEGVQIKVADDGAQKLIDAFWNDPINNMKRKTKKKIRELLIFGEQAWPAFVNEYNGHVRLGYLDPALIETVVTDPDNIEQPIGIVTVKDKKGRARRYRIILNGTEEDLFSARTREIRKTFDDGIIFFNRINELSNGSRGRSMLLPQIDWLDAYDNFLFGELDRATFMRAFMWDVTLKGATEDEIKKRVKNIHAPSPNSVRVHNDYEVWAAVTPDLHAGDSETNAKLFRNQVLGGATMPEHWYGGASDVNRATGESMSEPTFKIYSSLQQDIGGVLEDLAIFVINRAADPTGDDVLIDPYDPDPALVPECVWPELTARDTTKYAAALQQVTAAGVMAITQGLMTKTLVLQQINAISGRLGVEFDADKELTAAMEEAKNIAEDDVFEDSDLDDVVR
ncbi:MAG: phage portal protein [Candidatus Thiodiazotropha taylori]